MRPFYVLLLAASSAFAGWEELRTVTPGQKMEVSVEKGETSRGTFVSATETTIIVRDPSGERSIARSEVRRIKVSDPSRRLRNTLIGTAIGAGAGIGIGFAVCPGCANGGHGGKYVGPGVAAGAGAGALIGLLPAPYRTIYKK